MANFIRGTTPHIEITFTNFEIGDFVEVWITFAQNGAEKFTKTLADCTISEGKLYVHLTQDETLRLCAANTSIQIRALADDSEAYASKIFTFPTAEILKDGVIA